MWNSRGLVSKVKTLCQVLTVDSVIAAQSIVVGPYG